MTKVLFLIEKDLPADFSVQSTDVFAFFPELLGTNDKGMFLSYAHIGQHSACHIDYANECKEAEYYQYQDLLRELIGQGYKDLQIENKQLITCHRQPTKYELKFGEGATHYRDFTVGEIGINNKGDLKNWFVAKDDKLRYSTK